MRKYTPREIEGKWQKTWADNQTYKAVDNDPKQKYVMLTEFPYPSGDGLHLGHVREYTLGDIMARYKRMHGYNVLYPMGYDAFGLPTENYAIKNKITPQSATETNVSNFQKQFEMLGYSFDWSRVFNTSDPDYYKWTQWLFLQFFKHGLAYQDETSINWCPKCKTGLANEEVVNGNHERCDTPVEKKFLKQWLLAITKYADRLIDGLQHVDYPNRIADQQINWIGKSKGAEIEFRISKLEYRSYIMGQSNIEQSDIEAIGGKVLKVTDKGHLCVEFPASSTDKYEKLISDKMEPGFWNEYIGEEVVFIFKDNEERIYRKVWKDNIEQEILELCAKYANTDFKSVKSMLLGNSWYSEILQNSKFKIQNSIKVFTTRPDTLFGATFMVLAPEHPLVHDITTKEQKEPVDDYVKKSQAKSDIERQETDREKTGVFTGAYAVNPINNEPIPVWIADYVLSGYGTGAIMAVPAHDERDNEFAKKFNLPIKHVINPETIREDAIGKKIDSNKDKIVAVVINDNNELLTINWGPKYGGRLFIGGTVEEGEDAAKTALREITEETGYTDLDLLEEGEEDYHYTYYAFSKKETHQTKVKFYLVKLKTDKQESQNLDESEKNKFTVEWVNKSVADAEIKEQLHRYAYDKFIAGQSFHGEGRLVNSGKYDEKSSSEARDMIVADLEERGIAKEVNNYRLRDWIFSRQHYWGEPIPIIHCQKCGAVPVPEDDLPVELPKVDNYEPTDTGESPLAAIEDWVNVTCPSCGKPARRETDTMPNWAGSSWYYLRYFDAKNSKEFAAKDKLDYWGAVDMYLGGMEHTTLHLLYSRFWHQFFYDIGLVPTPEPYSARRGQGIILATDGSKMSKSKGNVVNPNDIIKDGYGADALRLSIAFLAPYDMTTPWNPEGVVGTYRFLNRSWNIVHEFAQSKEQKQPKPTEDAALLQSAHRAIKKVTLDLHEMGFNTAIAALMQYVNELFKIKDSQGFANQKDWQFACESLVKLIAPFAPHIAEELWQELGYKDTVHIAAWPKYDEGYLVESTMKIAVQVNGKLRGEVVVEQGANKDVIEAEAKMHENVAQHIKNDPKKVIYVPNKLINFVV